MKISANQKQSLNENHDHAWRGTWNRPMLMDEDRLHPFDVARMTDHNVRGIDIPFFSRKKTLRPTEGWENEGGIMGLID